MEQQFPHPEQLLITGDLQKLTKLTTRFWEDRRRTGDGPRFVRISKRAVRYRWGDVVEWLNKRMRNNTADMGE